MKMHLHAQMHIALAHTYTHSAQTDIQTNSNRSIMRCYWSNGYSRFAVYCRWGCRQRSCIWSILIESRNAISVHRFLIIGRRALFLFFFALLRRSAVTSMVFMRTTNTKCNNPKKKQKRTTNNSVNISNAFSLYFECNYSLFRNCTTASFVKWCLFRMCFLSVFLSLFTVFFLLFLSYSNGSTSKFRIYQSLSHIHPHLRASFIWLRMPVQSFNLLHFQSENCKYSLIIWHCDWGDSGKCDSVWWALLGILTTQNPHRLSSIERILLFLMPRNITIQTKVIPIHLPIT